MARLLKKVHTYYAYSAIIPHPTYTLSRPRIPRIYTKMGLSLTQGLSSARKKDQTPAHFLLTLFVGDLSSPVAANLAHLPQQRRKIDDRNLAPVRSWWWNIINAARTRRSRSPPPWPRIPPILKIAKVVIGCRKVTNYDFQYVTHIAPPPARARVIHMPVLLCPLPKPLISRIFIYLSISFFFLHSPFRGGRNMFFR